MMLGRDRPTAEWLAMVTSPFLFWVHLACDHNYEYYMILAVAHRRGPNDNYRTLLEVRFITVREVNLPYVA